MEMRSQGKKRQRRRKKKKNGAMRRGRGGVDGAEDDELKSRQRIWLTRCTFSPTSAGHQSLRGKGESEMILKKVPYVWAETK